MQLVEIIPTAGLVLAILFTFGEIFKETKIKNKTWIVPAVASFIFFILSLAAIVEGGSFGFWTEHIRNKWGN